MMILILSCTMGMGKIGILIYIKLSSYLVLLCVWAVASELGGNWGISIYVELGIWGSLVTCNVPCWDIYLCVLGWGLK